MRKVRPILVVAPACYLVLTWLKHDVLIAGILSCASFVPVTVMGQQTAATAWNMELLEYWIATVVWLVGGAVLIRVLLKNTTTPKREEMRFAESALALLAFISLSAPIIATVNPNRQGDLLTTRLLPPLSSGTISVAVVEPEVSDSDAWYVQLFSRSSSILLHRMERFEASERGTNESSVVFLFGTDDSGRDVFSRVVYGARVSMAIGFIAAIGALGLGTLVGFLAGYAHGIVDSILMRATDLILAIPSLFLVIGIMAFLDASVGTVILVLTLTGWMGIARTVRTEVLRLREREFVLAARLLHHSPLKILVRHILPNIMPLLVTAVTLQFSNAMLAEASLSFLGLGVQPPTASWGNLLGQALAYMRSGWWLGVFPGFMLTVALLASHAVAERQAGTPT